MRLLLEDFSRRWWPAFPVVIFFAFMAGASSHLPLLLWVMLAGPIVLSWDSMRGALKVQGTLPVSRKTLGRAAWFEAVLLFPLVCAPILVVVQVFGVLTNAEAFNTLAETLFFYVVGMGFASFMFLMLLMQPAAPAGDFRGDVKGGVFGGLWGLCFGGSMLLAMLARDLIASKSGTLLLVPALALIVTGYLFAKHFVSAKAGARAMVATAASPRGSATRVRMPGRWTGFITPWLWEAGFAFAFCAAVLAFSQFFSSFISGREAAASTTQSPFLVLFAVVVVAGGRPLTWLAGVRVLRALPLSRLQLALLYLALPCALFCAVLGFAAGVQVFVGSEVLAPQTLVLLLPLLGLCFLCNVLYLRTGSLVTLILPWLCVFPILLARPFHTAGPGSALASAALVCLGFLVVGFIYLHHLLGNSSDAYRRKSFVPGQPMNRG